MILFKYTSMQIDILIIIKDTKRRIPIYIKKKTIIPFQSQVFMVITNCKDNNSNLPSYNIIYKPLNQNNFISFAHLVSDKIKIVIMENLLNKDIII